MDRVEVIRSVYGEWARGDYRAGLELYDPDLTLEIHSPIPDAAVYKGVDGLQRYMRHFLETWDDYETRGESFEEDGNSVIVEVHHGGTAGGVPVTMTYFTVWTFEGDRVVRVDIAYDATAARAAAARIG